MAPPGASPPRDAADDPPGDPYAVRELPVSRYAGEIVAAVRENPVVVVIGETGSGKSALSAMMAVVTEMELAIAPLAPRGVHARREALVMASWHVCRIPAWHCPAMVAAAAEAEETAMAMAAAEAAAAETAMAAAEAAETAMVTRAF